METSVLEFKLLNNTFCFNTKNVEYVFDLENYESVHGFHSSVIGISKYNNDVMLLIDTAKLYGDKSLDLQEQKSVIVIKDEQNGRYGMLVDEIIKLQEIESAEISVDLNTQDMIINHYKDYEDDEIVSEVHPLPLFKKFNIPAMATKPLHKEENIEQSTKDTQENYLLFKINDHAYAVSSKYVKEVLEKDANLFELECSDTHFKGAMAVRNEVIPVIEIEHSLNSSDVLVLEVNESRIGIEVDEVYDIEKFMLADIKEIDNNNSTISAFYNYAGDVVAIIDPHFYTQKKTHNQKMKQEKNVPLHKKKFDYLLFLIDGKKFSIDMSYVRQVIETDTLQKTQSSSIAENKNVEFITTWNHKAVNILRLDLELGLECKKSNSQSIFIEYEGHHVAFMVHDIDNIVYINQEDITKSSLEESSLIDGAILYENEVIVKLSEQYISKLG